MPSDQFPRVFTTTSTGSICASSSGANYQFGFRPKFLRIMNVGTVDLWAKFGATSTGSTGDVLITSCGSHWLLELPQGTGVVLPTQVSIFATSTVASAINIVALG